jgi:hypothetical protein
MNSGDDREEGRGKREEERVKREEGRGKLTVFVGKLIGSPKNSRKRKSE